jgi:lysophospholipase L1-like esterase
MSRPARLSFRATSAPLETAQFETGFSKPRLRVIIARTLMNDQIRFDAGTTRRTFLKHSSLALGAASLAGFASASSAAESWPPAMHELIAKGDTILFQGDSITDAGRKKDQTAVANDQPALGNGYAWLAAAELLVGRPEAGLKVYNRGISGNKVYQLAERWQADCLDLKPNVLSVLIGVNDLWHTLNGNYDGTVEKYEKDYRALLERTLKALPKVKLVICEPFVLRCGAVNDKWFPEFDRYRSAAERVARSFHAAFLPFQTMFDEAVKYAPPSHWAADGVHPTSAGASLMAFNWLRTAAGKK